MSLFSDRIDFLLQREAVESRERQAEEKTDPSIQQKECLAECLLDLLPRSLHRSWIGNAPMRGHRLAGPYRTYFIRGVVTDRENEIEFGSIASGKLVPTLATKTSGWQVSRFELSQCFGTNCSRGMTTRAVSREMRLAFLVHDGLGHDGARRVSSAQKQHVVVCLHAVLLVQLSCSTSGRSRAPVCDRV